MYVRTEKEVSLDPEGEDALTLRFVWSSAASRVSGSSEFSAEVFGNGVRILYATDVSSSASTQAWSAVQAHLGAAAATPLDVPLFLAAVLSEPSDAAFDAASACLQQHLPPDPPLPTL
mmetsp:Transcript_9163/g.18304  ORF Transcript_9163/g.18304 Transcript_9163/m.18304 type:complete len:118 (-) Transcript_9163:67-420(-)